MCRSQRNCSKIKSRFEFFGKQLKANLRKFTRSLSFESKICLASSATTLAGFHVKNRKAYLRECPFASWSYPFLVGGVRWSVFIYRCVGEVRKDIVQLIQVELVGAEPGNSFLHKITKNVWVRYAPSLLTEVPFSVILAHNSIVFKYRSVD